MALVSDLTVHIKRGAEGLAFALGLESGHFRLAEFVADKIEGGFVLKTMDREKLAEDGLQADIPAFAYRNILLKELVVGIDLELDEVGWLDGLLQFTELDAFRHGFGAVPRVWVGRVSRPGSSADQWKQNIRHRRTTSFRGCCDVGGLFVLWCWTADVCEKKDEASVKK